jgi:ketosteroid isomerase-like protein
MKQHNFILALAVLFFGFGSSLAQSKSNASLDEAKKAIAESNDIYFTSFVKNDPSIFIARYAEDACIMPPDSPPLCGPNAAADFFRVAYDQILLRNGKFTTTAVYGDGKEFVTEEGRWFSYDANNNLMDDGKFLVLWKKTPKGWKMFRDSFSSNRTK